MQVDLVQKAAQNHHQQVEKQLISIPRNHLLIVMLRIWTKEYRRFHVCLLQSLPIKERHISRTQSAGKHT